MTSYHRQPDEADVQEYKLLKGFTQELRQRATAAEICLWQALRAKQLGVKFRRQHIIGGYITDFCCRSFRLVIELDGAYHTTVEQQMLDERRSYRLGLLGYRVLRFSNEQVLGDLEAVLQEIKRHLNE